MILFKAFPTFKAQMAKACERVSYTIKGTGGSRKDSHTQAQQVRDARLVARRAVQVHLTKGKLLQQDGASQVRNVETVAGSDQQSE